MVGNTKRMLLLTATVVFVMASLMVGCSKNPSYRSDEAGAAIVKEPEARAVEYTDAPSAAPVLLEAQGWWAKDSYVNYGVKVFNPNDNLVACNTVVHIVLRDKEGQVSSEYDQTISRIGPGETIGFAGEVGDGWTPASVDVELKPETTQWIDADGYVDPVTIVTCAEQDKLYFRYELTGFLTNNTSEYVPTIRLSALLLNEDGDIVAGYEGEAYKVKSGQTKSYLQTIDSAPDHASAELYAQLG